MAERIDDGGPAFPTDHSNEQTYTEIKGGMSLRDYFASKALIPDEVLGRAIDSAGHPRGALPLLAGWCYAWADAMLAERKKARRV